MNNSGNCKSEKAELQQRKGGTATAKRRNCNSEKAGTAGAKRRNCNGNRRRNFIGDGTLLFEQASKQYGGAFCFVDQEK